MLDGDSLPKSSDASVSGGSTRADTVPGDGALAKVESQSWSSNHMLRASASSLDDTVEEDPAADDGSRFHG